MSDIITTLHPENNSQDNLYPNIKRENIPNDGVTTEKILNNSITTEKILNNSITTNKLSNELVKVYNSFYYYEMVRGTVSFATGNTGSTGTAPKSMRSYLKIDVHKGDIIDFNSTLYNLYFVYYNKDNNSFLGYVKLNDNNFISNDMYGYLFVNRIDGSDLNNDEISTEAFSMKLYSPEKYEIKNSVYVNSGKALIKALSDNNIKNIYIKDDFETSLMIEISRDVNIYGLNHKISGHGVQYVFMVVNGNVNIYDLQLEIASDDVLYVGGNSKTKIYNCDISKSSQNDGVGLHQDCECYIYDCKIHDNYDEGLSTHDNTYCEVYRTEFYKNGYLVGTNTESGVSFGGCHFGGSRMGIASSCYCHNNSKNGIGFITIDNNYDPNAICICIDNICLDNVESGIRMGGASHIRCFRNTCFNNNTGIVFYKKDGHKDDGYVGGNTLFANTSSNQAIWTDADGGLVFDN